MVEREVVVKNKLGLHARPASVLAQKASKFKSEVRLIRGDMEINAKSVMGVMMLAAEPNSKIIIKAWGEDEEKVVEELVKLFENRFGEN